jgi:hypothetical protein
VADAGTVAVGVALRERPAVAVGVALTVGRVGVSEGVIVEVGLGGEVRVGVSMADGVAVAVAVMVVLGSGVIVGRRVAVGNGSSPTRKIICRTGPGLPPASSTRAVVIVGPFGNASIAETAKQNWARVRGSTKLCAPNSFTVHAADGVPANSNRHERSLMASAIDCSGP